MKILHVVGARPNFIKMAPMYKALENYKNVEQQIIHTGQHYDKSMYEIFFEEFNLPDPAYKLSISGGSINEQLSRMIIAFDKVFSKIVKTVIIVYGDVTSTLAAALVAVRYEHKIVHIEAGLRSFDNEMPEEINRMLVDKIAHRLYVTEQSGLDNLREEGVNEKKMIMLGNVMIDTLHRYLKYCRKPEEIEETLDKSTPYCVLTIHRPSNVDNKEKLVSILEGISEIAKKVTVIWPIHPRTEKNCRDFKINVNELEGVIVKKPLGYIDMLSLTKEAEFILTDSGGIQEEAAALLTYCVTIRENTERPSTIDCGSNRLVKGERESIKNIYSKIKQLNMKLTSPPLWDGKSSERIANDMMQWISRMES